MYVYHTRARGGSFQGRERTLTISRQIPLLPRQQPVDVKIPISDPQEPVSARRKSARLYAL